jgi:ABC-type branched-subunit amino acid transport system ATPase component/branched-subunit amino acid ABC-type transport system permease component
MSQLLQFIIIGLGAGGLYALQSLGINLVYRTSGVINFAQSAVGMAAAYAYWEVADNHGMGFWPGFLFGLAVSGVIGLLIYLVVMRPLRQASLLVRTIGTLGVLTILESVASLRYTGSVIVVVPLLPTTPETVFGATISLDRLIVLGIAVGLTMVLFAVYRFTSFGLRTSAVAENPNTLASLGRSPEVVSAANWIVGSMLAGVAGMFLAPIVGLQVDQLTLVIVPALAASVCGSMTSFPITFGAALAIGALQSVLARYVSNGGWQAAAPFLILLVVLALRGKRIPGREDVSLRLSIVGDGRVRLPALAVAVIGGAVLMYTLSGVWVSAITVSLVYAIVLLSIVVVTGYAGQISLAQFAMAGFGAWIASRLVASAHFSFVGALVVAVPATAIAGLIVGVPALRTRGQNLAVATLGLSVALEALIFDSSSLTGGAGGTVVPDPTIFGWDFNSITEPSRFGLVALIALVLLSLVVANVRRGASGRRLLAVRANERAAIALGVNPAAAKLYAFSLASGIAAVGGILYAFMTPTILMDNFTAFTSVTLAAFAVVGGLGSLVGPVVASTLVAGGIGAAVLNLLGQDVNKYLPLIGGIMVVLTLIAAPDGLVQQNIDIYKRLRKRLGFRPAKPKAISISVAEGSARRRHDKALVVENLSVRFGQYKAVDSVGFRVEPGQVVGLIGPNGAGKTTIIDAVTGFVSTDSGRVMLGDRDLSRCRPHVRAQAGLSRSFQSLELFEDINVFENVMVGVDQHRLVRYLRDLVWPGKAQVTPGLASAIEEFDLEGDLTRLPDDLPYGRRRLLAVARAVASEPAVLLLDEPAAGLDEGQRAELSGLIRRLADERNMAVLLIEHDVELIMRTCDHVLALEFGREICSGPPEYVRTNPGVIRAYVGDVDEELPTLDSHDAGDSRDGDELPVSEMKGGGQ